MTQPRWTSPYLRWHIETKSTGKEADKRMDNLTQKQTRPAATTQRPDQVGSRLICMKFSLWVYGKQGYCLMCLVRHARPRALNCPPFPVSLCRRCPVALVCILPFTVTSSFRGLAWPAVGLVVSPSRVQRPGTVCRPIFTRYLWIYLLPVSSTNSRLNCSSGHITWDYSTFVIVYCKRGRKLTLTHCILYCIPILILIMVRTYRRVCPRPCVMSRQSRI